MTVFMIKVIHHLQIDENQYHVDINRALLRHPEAKLEPPDTNNIQLINKNDRHEKRNNEPDPQQYLQYANVFLPVLIVVFPHSPSLIQSAFLLIIDFILWYWFLSRRTLQTMSDGGLSALSDLHTYPIYLHPVTFILYPGYSPSFQPEVIG